MTTTVIKRPSSSSTATTSNNNNNNKGGGGGGGGSSNSGGGGNDNATSGGHHNHHQHHHSSSTSTSTTTTTNNNNNTNTTDKIRKKPTKFRGATKKNGLSLALLVTVVICFTTTIFVYNYQNIILTLRQRQQSNNIMMKKNSSSSSSSSSSLPDNNNNNDHNNNKEEKKQYQYHQFQYQYQFQQNKFKKTTDHQKQNQQQQQQTTTSTSTTTDDQDPNHHVYDVLIIGAGWAGLGAGETLMKQGKNNNNFIILEAQDRIGGRSKTVYPFTSNLPIEVGSTWIYKNNHVYDLMKHKLKLPYGKINYDFDLYYGIYYYQKGNIFAGESNNNTTTTTTTTTDDDDSTSNNKVGGGEIVGLERDMLINELYRKQFVPKTKSILKKLYYEDNIDMSYREVLDMQFKNSKNHYFRRNNSIRKRKRQFLEAITSAQVQIEYGASLKDISAISIGLDGIPKECFFCKANYFVPVDNNNNGNGGGGGFDKIINSVVDSSVVDGDGDGSKKTDHHKLLLRDKIQLNSVVTKIEFNPINKEQPVKVTYVDSSSNNNNNTTTITTQTKLAKTVLLTVSLGVLKSNIIKFRPNLPSWKRNSIDTIGFGLLNKCIFYWDHTLLNDEEENESIKSWFPTKRQFMSLIVTNTSDESGYFTTFFNDKVIGNLQHYVLSAWIGGDNAMKAESLDDSQIVNHVLTNLRSMFGPNVPKPTKYIISRWNQDIYTRGSYSFQLVEKEGMEMDYGRIDLAKPTHQNRLYYAGEATATAYNSSYGTTYGAYESGISVIKQIQQYLNTNN